jgi:hypothetical protein
MIRATRALISNTRIIVPQASQRVIHLLRVGECASLLWDNVVGRSVPEDVINLVCVRSSRNILVCVDGRLAVVGELYRPCFVEELRTHTCWVRELRG